MRKQNTTTKNQGRSEKGSESERSGSYEAITVHLQQMLSASHVDELRRQTGYNPRQRIGTGYRLLLVCVEASLSGQTLGFSALRAFFIKRFGQIRPRAFQLRFKSESAAAFFRLAFETLVQKVVQQFAPHLEHALGGFTDVRVYDGSTQHVPARGREQDLKSTNESLSASKWVIGYSLKHGVAFEARGGSGCTSEYRSFKALIGTLVPGVLYLLDLAYFSKELYQQAQKQGAHLLLRLKAEPRFRSVLWVRRALEYDGQGNVLEAPRRNHNLPTYLKRVERKNLQYIDLDVRWGDGKTSLPLRVVGVYFEKQWRLYLTTVGRDVMSVSQIASTYRLRWLIEFLFREWKQQMDWGRSLTADRNALFCLTYAALFTHALVRSLRIAAALKHELPLESLRPLATFHVVRAFASDVISALLEHGTQRWNKIIDHLTSCVLLLAHEFKPSPSRPRIAAQLGAFGA